MADFDSKYSGEQVEALLDQVASGNAGGGGGGITVETDPIFSNSPAASITEDDIRGWNNDHAVVEDLNGDVAQLIQDVEDKQDALISGENIKTINGESILGEGDITIAGGSGEKGEKGDKGDTGVGVQSVKQTTTSNVDSGYNVVTVTLTDGTTSTFNVKNGSKGSSGSNGTNGKDGADGDDGATFTPSVDSAGNLSWTNNKGLANPPTVNIKGPKGDKGDAGEGGGSTGGGKVIASVSADMGGIIFGAMSWPPMSPNTIYVYDSGTILKHLTVYEFEDTSELYAEYSVIFKLEIGSDEDTAQVSLPEYVLWANGVIPQVEAGVTYELSITRTKLRGGEVFNAVLTPFKAV